MARRKARPDGTAAARAAMRAARRAEYVDALRDGRIERPATFTDRKRQANRDACRKGGRWE